MKKTITVILIVFMLVNLISVKSFAANNGEFDWSVMGIEKENDDYGTIFDDQEKGNTTIKNDNDEEITANTTGSKSFGTTAFSIIINVLTAIPQAANQITEWAVETTGNEDAKETTRFTIYDTVMGNYEIFNIDYINIPNEVKEDAPIQDIVKYQVLKYYNILRKMCLALSLFILIYIGIRMAISTLADNKAKYSKMLYNWLASVFLMIFMHLIVIIVSVLLKEGLNIVKELAKVLGVNDIESGICQGAMQDLSGASGWNMFTAFITISLLTYYQVKFFLFYLGRVIEINFLVVVSPLVTITYSIDKVRDNKAQAFQAWFGELITKASIQLIHAIVYCIFIASAGVIAQNHPILAVIFFSTLSRSEKIVRKIFSVKDDGFEKTKVPLID